VNTFPPFRVPAEYPFPPEPVPDMTVVVYIYNTMGGGNPFPAGTRSRRAQGERSRRMSERVPAGNPFRSRRANFRRARPERSRRGVRLSTPANIYIIIYLLCVPGRTRSRCEPVPGEPVPAAAPDRVPGAPLWRNI